MPPKKAIAEKTRTELFQAPFPHMLVTNFLSPELYKKAFEIYNKLEFKEKSSDLFHFFQTLELNQNEKLKFFKDELDQQFMRLVNINVNEAKGKTKKGREGQNSAVKKEDTFYNIFASYYFEGDYLLCHDDVVEDRIYAFSYYLEDHDSADLVLFNKEANKDVKRIKVKKNTLAIFEVSDISYHEVDYCSKDGRKAITGWFNIKGLGDKRIWKTIPNYVPNIPVSPIIYPLPPHYLDEEFFQLIDIEYQFNVSKKEIQGPFYSRRVHKIQISPCVVFQLPGYKLLSVEFLSFEEGDYILLNDPINKIEGHENIIDIFVTRLSEGFVFTAAQDEGEDEDEQGNVLVKIVQEDEEPSGIPEINDSLFIVHRGKKQYYVERVSQGKQFTLGHFIYVADNSPKEKKQKTKIKTKEGDAVIVPEKLKKLKKSKPAKSKEMAKKSQVKSEGKKSKGSGRKDSKAQPKSKESKKIKKTK